jgi:hypothetical protein
MTIFSNNEIEFLRKEINFFIFKGFEIFNLQTFYHL